VNQSLATTVNHHGSAEKLLQVALMAAEEAYGSHHPAVALALNNLGLWYKSSGRLDEAEFLYHRALSIAGPASMESASIHYNLGGLEQARGRFERAELYARQACEIRLRFRTTEHPDYATDESLLAAILDALGRFNEAEPLYWHALSVFEHTLGADHHEIAIHLNNMAANCYGRRDFAAAEALYKRSLEIKAKKLGQNHPSYEVTARNLAMVRNAANQRRQS
jgi:tetratricopeptide (TPR) repeat protein